MLDHKTNLSKKTKDKKKKKTILKIRVWFSDHDDGIKLETSKYIDR